MDQVHGGGVLEGLRPLYIGIGKVWRRGMDQVHGRGGHEGLRLLYIGIGKLALPGVPIGI